MSVIVRVEFREMPTPATLAAILANAVFDPTYVDSDILEDVDGDLAQSGATPLSEAGATVKLCGAVHPVKHWVCDAHSGTQHRMTLADGDHYDWPDDIERSI